MACENYVSNVIFNNNSVYTVNQYVDIDLVSTRNDTQNIKIYPQLRVFFSEEGVIYIFIGNYIEYKFIQKYGNNSNTISNDNQIFTQIDEQSVGKSYYILTNNELKFISNNTSKHGSWKLSFLKTVNNIYVSNKNVGNNIGTNVSGLNFSLFGTDSDMTSENIFRLDNTLFTAVGNMGLIIDNTQTPKVMKNLYNSNYWMFNNKQNTQEGNSGNTKGNNKEVKPCDCSK